MFINASFKKLRSAEGAFDMLLNFKKIKSREAINKQARRTSMCGAVTPLVASSTTCSDFSRDVVFCDALYNVYILSVFGGNPMRHGRRA